MQYSIPSKFQCMIVDLSFVITTLEEHVLNVFSFNYKNDVVLESLVSKHYKHLIVKSLIFNSLRDVFCLPIVLLDSEKHYHFYSILKSVQFSNMREISNKLIFTNIDRNALNMFKDSEIIPFLREQSLYLFSKNDNRFFHT